MVARELGADLAVRVVETQLAAALPPISRLRRPDR
jgi:hypothetical protein